ncbi:MAG: hypothetical protein VKS61_18410 [Candidatus Sericytochromatia bacterium]|nr:hypothetical protein [Candidatus Sericytochromatia bacterium]
MFIDPALHERFVDEFGLNMINTLTGHDRRVIARRAIHVFDERGGVMGGANDTLQAYQNLTTGVFHTHGHKVVGVRYRCEPEAVGAPALGAFHTHPALWTPAAARLRRRIDQLLWLSEADRAAFREQHRIYGYRWHFVGCVDIACFHIADLDRGREHPRFVLRYPHLERLMARLEPVIAHYDRRLQQTLRAPGRRGHRTVAGVVRDLTGHEADREGAAGTLAPAVAATLARCIDDECRLRGVVPPTLERVVPQAHATDGPPPPGPQAMREPARRDHR